MRAASPPTYHPLPLPSPPLPPPSSPLLPPVDSRKEVPKADLPPRKEEIMPCSHMVDDATRRHVPREVGYGITNTWDELVDAIQEGAPTTLKRVNARVTKLAETYERDTQDLYAHLEDAQDSRARLLDRVDILLEDRQFHQLWAAVRQFTMGFRHIELTLRHKIFALVAGDIDIDLGCSDFITIEPANNSSRSDSGTIASMAVGLAFSFISVSNYHKMPPRKGTRTRTTPATATATTPMTDAAIRALIARGVADALVEQEI
ncbi:hypothetical protein Tco_0271482 [Tanacetum coccineum]